MLSPHLPGTENRKGSLPQVTLKQKKSAAKEIRGIKDHEFKLLVLYLDLYNVPELKGILALEQCTN